MKNSSPPSVRATPIRSGPAFLIVVILAVVLLPERIRAADGTWTKDATGTQNWSATANWLSSIVADGQDSTATFGSAITAARTVTLDSSRTIGNLSFNNSFAYTIAGGSTLTLSTSSGTPTITCAGGGGPGINAIVAGSQGFIKNGTNGLMLRATNTITGTLTLNAGTVRADNTNSLNRTSPMTLIETADGTQIYLNPAGTFANNMTLIGSGVPEGDSPVFSRLGALRLASSANPGITVSGTITLAGDAGITPRGGGVHTISGQITGGYSVRFGRCYVSTGTTTAGTIILSNTGNDWTGDTIVADGQTRLGAAGVIPNGSGKGNLVLTNEGVAYNSAITNSTFDLNGFSETVNGLAHGTGVTGGDLAKLVVTNSSATAATLTVGDNNVSASYGGLVRGNLALTKIGNGTQTLSGANTYTGITTVNNGTLALSGSGSIANSAAVAVAGGATFDVSGLSSTFTLGASQTLSNSSSTAILNGNLNASSGTVALTFASGTPAFTVTSGTLTLAAGITFTINNTGAELGVGNYTIISAGGGSVGGTAPTSVAITGGGAGGLASLTISGGELILEIAAGTPPPTITSAVATPSTLTVGQSTLLTVAVSGGVLPNTVTVDASAIGGSPTLTLDSDGEGNYTNTIAIGASTALGNYSLPVTVTDDDSQSDTASIALTVQNALLTWTGGGGDDNWSTAANWGGAIPIGGDSLAFDGSTRLVNLNNTTAGTLFSNLTFNAGAGAFVLNGNSISLPANSGITNNAAANTQTVNLGVVFGASETFNGGTGGLILGGGLTSSVNGTTATTLSLQGVGTLTNSFGVSAGATGTNILSLSGSAANWTIAGSTASSVPWGVSVVSGGTLNFGTTGSAPDLSLIGADLAAGSRFLIGDNTGSSVVNFVNGSLTVAGRLNVGNGTAAATLNISGGTLNANSAVQVADNNIATTGTINMSGGTLNANSSFFLTSRGTGTLNLSGGSVNAGTVELARNLGGQTPHGTINLNGGTLAVNNLQSSSTVAGSTANVNFNGGTLKARQATATFLNVNATTPLVATVKTGGALVDDGGFNITIPVALQHDSALGATPDGGLTKQGAGTLTLTAANSYTGDTTISAGTLRVDGSLAADSDVAVNSTGTLGGTGTVGGTVTVAAGGTLAPGASIGTLTLGASPAMGGTTAMEIDAAASPNADKLVISGNPITCGGTLTVVNNGAALTGGEVFDLFDATSFSGAFAATNLPSLDAGLNWWLGGLLADGSILVNRAPVASAIETSVAQGDSVAITIIGGKHAPTDADGNTLSVSAVSSPTANGGSVSTDGTSVTYTASSSYSGSDSFTYTVSDGRGGVDTKTVTVTVTPASSGFNVTSVSVSGGVATVQALGIPGQTYRLQYTESLSPASWQNVSGSEQTAAGNGQITLSDPGASGPSRFYRTQHVP